MKSNLNIVIVVIVLFFSSILVLPSSSKENTESNSVVIDNIEIVTITDSSMIITWTTDVNSSTYVNYGHHPFFLENSYSENSQSSVTFHYLETNNLKPNRLYFYRIGSDNSKSRLRVFKTLSPPSGEYLFSFATIADRHAHPGDKDAITLGNLAVSEINNRYVDFVIDRGDMGHPFNVSKEIIDGFNISYYPCYGDNDFQAADGNAIEFIECYDLNSTYYSYDHMGYHFVILDSINRNGYETGDISKEEFVWLESDLEKNSDKKIMIFLHHPASAKDIPAIMALNAVDGVRFRSMISKYDVVGVFSGHTHRNKVTHSSKTGYVPYSEASSLHKYPCGYNIYKVYTDGYMQIFYKVNSELTEKRRDREKEDFLSPICGRFGFIWDRNFVVRYSE